MNENNNAPTEQPYLKLTKNSRGYTWDIKIIGLDVKALSKKNNEMIEEFGSDLKTGSGYNVEE